MHSDINPWLGLLSLLPLLYVNAPRTWIPGEMVTSGMMNTIRDLFLEIEAGTAEQQNATLEGRSSASLSSDLSAAGQATVAYDSTEGTIVASLNGSAYEALGGGAGGFLPSNAVRIAMGL